MIEGVYRILGLVFLALLMTLAIIGLHQSLVIIAAALLLAYITEPIVAQLERWRISRALAILIVMIGILVLFLLGLMGLFELLYQQISHLIVALPNWLEAVLIKLQPIIQSLNLTDYLDTQRILNLVQQKIQNLPQQGLQTMLTSATQISHQALRSISDVLTTIASFYLAPLLYYHLLNQRHQLMPSLQRNLPQSSRPKAAELWQGIDDRLRLFLRGLLALAAIRSLVYASGLSLIGLQQGFICGLLMGVLSIIPYLGIGVGIALTLLIALATFSSWWLLLGLVVFLTSCIILDNLWLQQKLIETPSGLSQLSVVLAVIIGGNLLGTIGLFFAVPMMAVSLFLASKIIASYHLQEH